MALSESIMFGVFTMLSYGLADFFAKKAVGKFGPLLTLKVALISGTLPLLIYSLLFVALPSITANTMFFVFLAGLTGVVGWAAFFTGLNKGKVSIVSPLASSWGMVPFVLAIFVLSESLSTYQILFSVLIFIGIFLISVKFGEVLKASKGRLYAGAWLAIVAMVFFGLSGFFTKFVVDDISPFYSVVMINLVTMVPLLFYRPRSRQGPGPKNKLVWVLILVGILNVIGYTAFSFGLSLGSVSIVSAITSAAPLVAILMALAFLRERLVTNQCLGVLLIVGGLAGLSLF